MSSVWSESITKKKFESLEGNLKTDVLIIGGGMAGLLCAYMLKSKGVDCILTEQDCICSGTTKNTTAKLTFQHGLIFEKLIGRFGKEKAKLYIDAHRLALKKYEGLCANIDCDYEIRDSYVYSLRNREKIEKEALALGKLGIRADFTNTAELPFETVGAVRIREQAQFNPLKFAYSIAEGLPIYENTRVKEISNKKAVTEHGEISFKRIISATHFPFVNKHGMYFLKMYQHRSYVLALEGAKKIDGMYVDENGKGLSLRGYGNLLLLGGGGHRTGKSGGGYTELEKSARAYYPEAKIVNAWGAQDCMTLDGMAYIGRYAKSTPDFYVATGFNKWGMSSSMLSAIILSDRICGIHNEYAELFSPSRSMLSPQLAINLFESAKGLLTPTVPRCSHMGCALKYNAAEHSWDCSCHGSRFSESGEVINSPAMSDKKGLKSKNNDI